MMSQALGVSAKLAASQAPRVTPGAGGFHPYSMPIVVEGPLLIFLHLLTLFFFLNYR